MSLTPSFQVVSDNANRIDLKGFCISIHTPGANVAIIHNKQLVLVHRLPTQTAPLNSVSHMIVSPTYWRMCKSASNDSPMRSFLVPVGPMNAASVPSLSHESVFVVFLYPRTTS